MSIPSLLKKTELPFEVVILLIVGMAMLITGTLLFPVSSGALPYYEDGLYGLLLVMFALQIVTMGKTPFGDVRRSRLIIAVGAVISAVGIVTCFIPDVFYPSFTHPAVYLLWSRRLPSPSADVV
ncbi:MAG TPA: hypothetical protein PLG94_00280 [Smithellaceae bacterium]|jgi:hypothetical protein|nr:hypothetical protein [Smithellaceae bacterium]HPL64928.1 hypothetical protein [Smithellaceae bacterium]